ncbi:AfsR/SARP family transcriptional regulator [Nonomuraea longicatena]|uniref:Transcriptional regulator AfsR n=1 Tax=Nonomuraea longicatena TaxID=83682 RepID=A0ABP3ZDM3_9ACTN
MRFRLLGPLRVWDEDAEIDLRAPKQRTLLATLLVRAGHVVPVRSLVAEVWPEQPPRSAVANLRTYLMQLRRRLRPVRGLERLVTADAGYLLRVEQGELDLHRFETLTAAGRRALAARDLGAAQDAYTRALELWDGTAAEDVPAGPMLREVVARLTDRYLYAVEEHAEIQLALGAHPAAARRLRQVIAQYPLRERLHAQLMLALYRHGDVIGALDAFAAARRLLADELGIDPGPELRRLHQAMLSRDTAVLEAVAPAGEGWRPRPRQLPRAPSPFVGRDAELAALRASLEEAASEDPARERLGPPVTALHGPGGVGKSALALTAAGGAAEHYPDGQLYVDLQGAAPGLAPLNAAEVLGRFLRALGVPPAAIPASAAEAATLYQSVLAGRRVLVVLDNAVGAAQVGALLPAHAGCAAIVTSRSALTTLDAVSIGVGTLREPESVRMLALLAGQARVAAEPRAAAEIARWCGHFPLALRVAGARLAGRPDWTLAGFGERLRDAHRRLDELETAELRVRSCFDVGYGTLSARAKAAFRVFGVLAVPAMSVALVAVALDVQEEAATAALDELAEARLVEPAPCGRFGVHDLARLYAAEQAAAGESVLRREEMLRRVMEHYAAAGRRLRAALQPHLRGGDAPEQAGDPAEAVGWLEDELPNLVAVAAQAAQAGPEPERLVPELMNLVRSVGMKGGHWREMGTLAELSVEVARRRGDLDATASALVMLGLMRWRHGDQEGAHDRLWQALELWRTAGDREAEGLALHNLGWLAMQYGDARTAHRRIVESLTLLESAGGSPRLGMVGHNLGEALAHLGRHREAADRLERCLAVRRADGDLYGESITLAALGRVYGLLGEHDKALATLDAALELCGRTGNREDEWQALLSRSEVLLRQGRAAFALADVRRALEVAGAAGDAYGRAAGMRQRARARTLLGETGAEADARLAEELFADPAVRRDPVMEQLLSPAG